MNVGMIFECGQNGADGKVYPYLAKQIRPDIHICPFFLDRKPTLIQKCGSIAKNSLEIDGCECIVIIWDLRPPWQRKEEILCPIKDCNLILTSLKDALLTPVQLQKIHLICIEQELETLLLFDVQALSEYLGSITHRPCRVRRMSRPERCYNPKNALYKIFEEHGCHKYEDLKDAEKIIKLVDINKLRKCLAFQRFERRIKCL